MKKIIPNGKIEFQLLCAITILGGILRFYNLGKNPLWIDECLFAFLIKNPVFPHQEFIPVMIGKLFGFHSEFWLRFQSALCGTLTIPAVYFIVKEKKIALSLLVAVFPLFVFWSRLARPYSIAGFFVVLGWKYWIFDFFAIATTPISVIGVKITKKRLWLFPLFIIFTIGLYLIRPDVTRNWTVKQIFESSRWFYVPAITFLLYFWDYILPKIINER